MPELPEVEIIRRYLDKTMHGLVITNVEILRSQQIEHPAPADFEKIVAGRTIVHFSRRGKYLCMHLADCSRVFFHLRMTGSLVYEPSGKTADPYARVVFSLSDGGLLVFADVRTFGRLYGLRADERDALLKGLAKLGPEPLSTDFSAVYLMEAVRGRKQPIKSFLLDQRRVAGIGNIYADEALFAARIFPGRPTESLTKAECQRLQAAVQKVLRDGLKDGGTTFRDYRNGEGGHGHHQEHLFVYHREGQPCRLCGAPIEKFTLGGRGTHFCSHCQPKSLREIGEKREKDEK